MSHYEFTVTLSGEGDTAEDAWRDAVDAFASDPGEPHTVSILEGERKALSLARDVMVTAVEGGSDYWAQFKDVLRVDAEETPQYLDIISFSVRPAEPAYADNRNDPRDQWQEIDGEKILEAMRKIARKGGLVSSGRQADIILALLHDDASHIDAEAADCIVQVACFGEVVFG